MAEHFDTREFMRQAAFEQFESDDNPAGYTLTTASVVRLTLRSILHNHSFLELSVLMVEDHHGVTVNISPNEVVVNF